MEAKSKFNIQYRNTIYRLFIKSLHTGAADQHTNWISMHDADHLIYFKQLPMQF
jgi:hypothetical protein